MTKAKRVSKRGTHRPARSGAPGSVRDESGGFLQQLGLAETGGTAPGLIGIGLALLLALITYPIGWMVRRARRRS